LAIRLFLSACVASLALGAALAEKESQAQGPQAKGVQADGAQAQIHYAPRENLESVDVREIGRAQLSIDMAAYVLSDPRVIEALTDAAERGVVIRLYLDKSQFAEHGPTRGGLVEALLAHPNVAARVKGEGVLMHLKAYAVDGVVLRTGSGNFSRSGLEAQDNDAIFITDPAVVDAFEGNFERIWAQNVAALDTTR
jgi:phosphatidylserine/phosphatidylglycerophosphate/cardiolipin synthase-like enzyme